MNVTRIGVDIAKQVFQLHGVDRNEKVVLRRQLRRAQFLEFLGKLSPCLIGMEACGGAHHWARELSKLGHTVRLIAAQRVKPYVKNNKNDARDAEAICEALGRPSMQFVPIKTVQQQDLQALLRIREELVHQRTAKVNQTRGLLAEYGLVFPKGIEQARKALPIILDEQGPHGQALSASFRVLLQGLWQDLQGLDERVAALEGHMRQLARDDEAARRLCEIPGVGPQSALALVIKLGDGSAFARARDASASLGVTPRQDSTGGRERLLGITKRGDSSLRTLLIHGARSVLRFAGNKTDPRSRWLMSVAGRRHPNIAAVALANKNARIAWAMLTSGEPFRPECYESSTPTKRNKGAPALAN
jgi:transposase